jgi:glycosyltransferase involved in cell wall biosynthesis
MSPAISLRILHTESSLNWGGQEYRTLEEVRWLRAHGHAAWIACNPDSEMMVRAGPELCVPLKMDRSLDWRASSALRRFCHEQRVNVVHTHSSKDSWLCYPLYVEAWPVVRSRQITNPVRRSLDRSFIYRHGCTAIVASADCIRNNLIAETGVAAERVQVIGEGTDVDRFNPSNDRTKLRAEWGISAETVLFGVVAMIRPEKGHRQFVEAAIELTNTHVGKVRFAIVGEGVGDRGYEREIRDLLTSRLGTATNGEIFMTGYRKDVADVMAALDVLVVPSLAEAQSIVTPQAFATGRPVIASRVGGLPELITHEQTGLLVEPGDAAGLTAAMARVVDDQALRTRMGANAREYAQRALSFSAKMEECVSLYASVAASCSKSPLARRRTRSGGKSVTTQPRQRRRPIRMARALAPLSVLAFAVMVFLHSAPKRSEVVQTAIETTAGLQQMVTSPAPTETVYDNGDEPNVDESLSPAMFSANDDRIIG